MLAIATLNWEHLIFTLVHYIALWRMIVLTFALQTFRHAIFPKPHRKDFCTWRIPQTHPHSGEQRIFTGQHALNYCGGGRNASWNEILVHHPLCVRICDVLIKHTVIKSERHFFRKHCRSEVVAHNVWREQFFLIGFTHISSAIVNTATI